MSFSSYLNTQYVKKNVCNDADATFGASTDPSEHIMDIREMALECWRTFMIMPMRDKLIKLVLDGIDRDRKGESVNQSVLHGVINSLVEVADKRQKTLFVSINLAPFIHFSLFLPSFHSLIVI
jgi:hypothetical protein